MSLYKLKVSYSVSTYTYAPRVFQWRF